MSLGPPPADPARLVTRGFVALAVATLAFFIAAGIVLPVAPTFAKEALGADETGVGIAIASFSIASLILRPLVGWSSDRFGRRPLLIGGALLTVAALGLHLVATDLPLVANWLASGGSGLPAAWVSLDATDSDRVSFWRYVVAAIRTASLKLGDGPLAALEAAPPQVEEN